MSPVRRGLLVIAMLSAVCGAAPRRHTIILGKWQTIAIASDSGEQQTMKMRSLTIDGGFKEFTVGAIHQVSDRVLVVRKVERLNDALPEDDARTPRWIWRLGGWISVDRLTGRVTQLNLPAFDPAISQASWYRDYSAYCGTSDDGARLYMVVAQLGKRKPLLRREYTGTPCGLPQWARGPGRVTFTGGGEKASFVVRSHGAEPQPETGEEGPQ